MESRDKLAEEELKNEQVSTSNEQMDKLITILNEDKLVLSDELRKTKKALTATVKCLKNARTRVSDCLEELRNVRRRVTYWKSRTTSLRQEIDKLTNLQVGRALELTMDGGAEPSTSNARASSDEKADSLVQNALNPIVLAPQNCVVPWRSEAHGEAQCQKRRKKHLHSEIRTYKMKCGALHMKAARARKRIDQLTNSKKEALNLIRLTSNGIYSTKVRTLVRRIVASGCPLTKCGIVLVQIMKFVSSFLGVSNSRTEEKICIPSVRTIRRIIGEGNVASKLQNAHELKLTRGEFGLLNLQGYNRELTSMSSVYNRRRWNNK